MRRKPKQKIVYQEPEYEEEEYEDEEEQDGPGAALRPRDAHQVGLYCIYISSFQTHEGQGSPGVAP